MPDFFDLMDLPEEKRLRWDSSMAEYQRIREANLDRELASMTGVQFDALLDTFPKQTFTAREALALAHAGSGGEGHPKSALFARLLDGKSPLPFPPPLYFSFPWYEIFDQLVVHEVNVKIDRSGATPSITLGDFKWDQAQQLKPGEWVVTTGDWAKPRTAVSWRLKQERLLASESTAYIAAWHDAGLARVTTLAQLKSEVAWHVSNKYKALDALKTAQPEEISLARDKKLYLEALRQNKISKERLEMLQQGLYLLMKRRKRNLPDLPNKLEKSQEAITGLARYFVKSTADGHYEVDEHGVLWRRSWSIERMPSAFLNEMTS